VEETLTPRQSTVGVPAPGIRSSTAPGTRRTAGAGKALKAMWRLVYELPDLVPAAVAGFTVVAVIAMLLSAFRPWVVLPVGVASGGALAWLARSTTSASGESPAARWWSVGALVLATASTAVNGLLSSQWIMVARDPGFYQVTAKWLSQHGSLHMPTDLAAFGGVIARTSDVPGFYAVGRDLVEAQGMHALPAFLASMGWIGDDRLLLSGNAILGGAFVLALFALARRLAGGGPALVVSAALAASMPFVAFARSPYTEPGSAAVTLGGLALLVGAIRQPSNRSYAVAGVVFGSAPLWRVDGFMNFIAVPLLVAVLLVAGWATGKQVLAFVLPQVLLGGLALVDLYVWAGRYGPDLHTQIRQMGLGALASIVAAVVLWTVLRLRPSIIDVYRRISTRLGTLALLGSIGLFVLLVSRPLWIVYRHNASTSATLAAFQQGSGLAPDGSRSYEEYALTWIAWYFGWVMVAVGAVGVCLLAGKAVAGNGRGALALLALVAPQFLVYMNRMAIFPDQIWAMRRFLPAIIPLLLVGAAVVLAALWSRGMAGRAYAVVISAALIGLSAALTLPVARDRQWVGTLGQVTQVCDAVGNNSAILLDNSTSSSVFAQSLRAWCDVPVQVTDLATVDLAAAHRGAASVGNRLFAVEFAGAEGPDRPMPLQNAVTTYKWPELIGRVPHDLVPVQRWTYLGEVQPDGSLAVVQ
jgi:hypothetical protein